MADHSPLRIVHVVVTDAFAGVERYVCQVVNELAARGHRVTTIGGDAVRMRSELDPGVTVHPVRTLTRAAVALVRSGPQDIVHVHMTTAEGAAWLARPGQPATRVATRHFARDRGSNPLNRFLSHLTSRGIAQDIAVSQFVAQAINGGSVVIPNGVPDRPQADLEAHRVLMLQRLTPEKAPDIGLRAWSASGLGAKGWRLVVAGDGTLREPLLRLADDLGVGGNVEFLGQVTATDDQLARSSILLAPAPAEPFGLSVVEAMAHGVPVVAARGGGHIETVGDRGILFGSDDPREAGRALAALAQDRAKRVRIGHDLRRRQQNQFSLAAHTDRLEDLYTDLVAAERRRQPAP